MGGNRASEERGVQLYLRRQTDWWGWVLRKEKGGVSPLLTLRWYNFSVSHSSCPGQFQNFSLHDPLYGKLFSAYLRPPHKPRSTSQIPNASFPSSRTALANGTVQTPKQKGD